MITRARMTLETGNRNKKCMLLGLLIQISPGLVSSKCSDYLKVCVILDVVATSASVVSVVSHFIMCHGYER